ncbi:MAG: RNA polymerase sigma factor [Chloroflexota bacterium]
MDSTQLLAKCRAGDGVAVAQLVNEFQPRLFRLALSILDDGSENGSADAEEITQDALVAALRSLDSYRGDASLSTWLYAITINLCRNRLRARQRRQRMRQLFQALTAPIEDAARHPETVVIQNETRHSLLQAVHALDEKHRLPVILRYYHDCSVSEIAHMLDLPEGTVHSRLNKARRQLKQCWQPETS